MDEIVEYKDKEIEEKFSFEEENKQEINLDIPSDPEFESQPNDASLDNLPPLCDLQPDEKPYIQIPQTSIAFDEEEKLNEGKRDTKKRRRDPSS